MMTPETVTAAENEITISPEAIKAMRHAIGLDYESPKRGKYRAYRNYAMYSAPHPVWEGLVSRKLASCLVEGHPGWNPEIAYWYTLTRAGLDLMETMIGAKIEEDNPMTRETILKKCLDMASHNLLCYSDSYLMDKPRAGFEEQHSEAAAEVEILKAWLNEFQRDIKVADRLTKRNSFGSAYYSRCFDEETGRCCTRDCSDCDFTIEMCERMASYEDAEEQDRLVVLPCKVGDTVYEVVEGDESTGQWYVSDERQLGELGIELVYNGERDDYIPLEEIGKTVFLTRKEAEAELERVQAGGK